MVEEVDLDDAVCLLAELAELTDVGDFELGARRLIAIATAEARRVVADPSASGCGCFGVTAKNRRLNTDS